MKAESLRGPYHFPPWTVTQNMDRLTDSTTASDTTRLVAGPVEEVYWLDGFSASRVPMITLPLDRSCPIKERMRNASVLDVAFQYARLRVHWL